MQDADEKIRLFVGLGLPDQVKQQLSALPPLAGKPHHPDDLHITLRFLGEIDPWQLEEIQEKLSQIRKNTFPIVVKGLASFEKKDRAVIYAGIENPKPILDLAARIGDKLTPLGFNFGTRPMVPHITLVKGADRRQGDAYIRAHDGKVRATWLAERFHLFQSDLDAPGRMYSILDTYPLLV